MTNNIVQLTIEEKLAKAFSPSHLEVVNESHMHNVPPGSESHFKVVIVTPAFDEVRKVKRHQMIYGELKEELAGSVHALALHTYATDEWPGTDVPDSPDCLGGSKHDKA